MGDLYPDARNDRPGNRSVAESLIHGYLEHFYARLV
jgi:hypothetical protein